MYKLKIGDRVRCITTVGSARIRNAIGTIFRIGNSCASVKFERDIEGWGAGNCWNCEKKDLVPLKKPLSKLYGIAEFCKKHYK